MKNGWPHIALGEILTERRTQPDATLVSTGDIPIVSKISFDSGTISLRPAGDTKTGMIQVEPGDLLISGINAYKGAIAHYTGSSPVAATIHYGAYAPRDNRADMRFLWWMLRSHAFRDLLEFHVPGGIKTELKSKRLLPIPIPLPPIEEQRRILARIEALAAKVAEAGGLRNAGSAMLSVLGRAALLQYLKNECARQRWPIVPLRDAVKVARGKFTHRPRNEPRFYGGDIPFIQIGDISNANRYLHEFTQTLNEEGLAISRKFPKGTVVIAITGATIGVTGILGIDACFPDSIVGLIPETTKTVPEYVYWSLEYAKDMALAGTTQSTQPNMNLQDLDRVRIPLPPLAEQRRIVAYLDSLSAKAESLKSLQHQSAAELDALLPSILDRAFQGDL